MSRLSFRPLDPIGPGPFAQYLLPSVVQMASRSPGDLTCLGAVWDQSACGAAAVRWTQDCGVLVSLFVDPLIRGQGVAGALLDRVIEACARRGVTALSASYVLRGGELDAMDALFRSRGAEPVPMAPTYEMDTSRFHQARFLSPAFQPDFRPDSHVQVLTSLSQEQLDALEADPDIPEVLLPSACGDRLEPGLSVAWTDGGRILAYVLGGESGPASCSLLAAWRGADAPASSFLSLLQAQLNLCYYRCGGDFRYFLSAISPGAAVLTEHLTGGDYTLYEEHAVWLDLSPGETAPSPDGAP